MANPVNVVKESVADMIRGVRNEVRNASRPLRETAARLREEHGRLKARLQQMPKGRPPQAELQSNQQALRQAYAAAWHQKWDEHLLEAWSGHLRVPPEVAMPATKAPSFGDLPAAGRDFGYECAIAEAGGLAQLFSQIITQATYTPIAPLAEQPGVYAEIEAEIARVEAQHSALCDEAASGDEPITIPLLEDVRSRRAYAAHLLEREAARDRASRHPTGRVAS
jgi:hypothetical protein